MTKACKRPDSRYFAGNSPVAAICQGVVLASRARRADGKSVLFGKRTTSLLKSQELMAWGLTCLWLGSYYRTYSLTVEDEVRANLDSAADFLSGPLPLARDKPGKLDAGFVVRDGNFLSARWPGDAHKFADTLLGMLSELPLA